MSVSEPELPLSQPAKPSPTSLRNSLAALCLVVLVACGLTAGGHLYSPDEEIMYRTARSLWTEGNLGIEPLGAGPGQDGFASRKGRDGQDYAQYGLGNSLLAGPLVLLGELAAWVVPEKKALSLLDFQTVKYLPEGEKPGAALIRRFVVSWQGSLILAATACVLFLITYRLTEQWSRQRTGIASDPSETDQPTQNPASPNLVAWAVALSYVLGTIAWPHARTFFSEPLAGFGILLAFYGAGFGTVTPRRCLAIGLALGLALLTRLDSAVMVPGVGLTLLMRYSAQRRDDLSQDFGGAWDWTSRVILQGAFARLLGLLLIGPFSVGLWQMTFNWMHFGGPLESAYADQSEGINFSTPLFAGLHGFFGSPGKSVFLFSPALILALVGWRRLHYTHFALAAGLLLAIGAKVWLHATWQNWAGGWCWGPRHILQVHALAIIGAWGFVVLWGPVRRVLLVGVVASGAFVQLYGSSQSFIDYYILYYRSPLTPPQAVALYSPGEDATTMASYQATVRHPDSGREVTVPLNRLPAPLSDSIYVPQNTQWYRYSEMSRLGYTDNLWLRLIRRARDTERPLE